MFDYRITFLCLVQLINSLFQAHGLASPFAPVGASQLVSGGSDLRSTPLRTQSLPAGSTGFSPFGINPSFLNSAGAIPNFGPPGSVAGVFQNGPSGPVATVANAPPGTSSFQSVPVSPGGDLRFKPGRTSSGTGSIGAFASSNSHHIHAPSSSASASSGK